MPASPRRSPTQSVRWRRSRRCSTTTISTTSSSTGRSASSSSATASWSRYALTFPDDSQVFHIAEAIAAQAGRSVDTRRPLLDARLPDGSRVNVIAPPLAVDGTAISIRKFPKRQLTIDAMIESKNMSPALGDFLKVCGKCRLNIIVSGGTGSGKTTLLNALSQHIDPAERIVTIEDAAELRLQQPHVVRLETRPSLPARGGGQHARPRQERAAHAAGPHHRRRGAGARGLRHDAGNEHRPRRLAHHHPRQSPARRAGPAWRT